MGSHSAMPSWLEKLLAEKFFSPCAHHEGVKKNEKNILCLDCCFGFCPHCILPHRSHRMLQIRRYVYHDVVRVEDLEKLVDMSLVQVKQLMMSEGELSRHLRKCEYLPLSIDDEGHLTPDSILESPGCDSSGSMGSGGAKDSIGDGGGGALCGVVSESSLRRSRSFAGVYIGTVLEPAGSLRKRWRKMNRPNRSPLF